MYGIFTFIWVIYGVNVGKCCIHEASGNLGTSEPLFSLVASTSSIGISVYQHKSTMSMAIFHTYVSLPDINHIHRLSTYYPQTIHRFRPVPPPVPTHRSMRRPQYVEFAAA